MTGQLGVIYMLHFHQPYRHARHYVGNPESSRFLKGFCRRTWGWWLLLGWFGCLGSGAGGLRVVLGEGAEDGFDLAVSRGVLSLAFIQRCGVLPGGRGSWGRRRGRAAAGRLLACRCPLRCAGAAAPIRHRLR